MGFREEVHGVLQEGAGDRELNNSVGVLLFLISALMLCDL